MHIITSLSPFPLLVSLSLSLSLSLFIFFFLLTLKILSGKCVFSEFVYIFRTGQHILINIEMFIWVFGLGKGLRKYY